MTAAMTEKNVKVTKESFLGTLEKDIPVTTSVFKGHLDPKECFLFLLD